ncbi:hypothetical protein [uncultured Treponema sp.]|uniref:hypothetical protein n=1 Tax=uncultured Treponema sp. TaxID=162155 RepID=UPI0025EEBC7E|nr:hypothetical protein [uncultured Treponema sp.]
MNRFFAKAALALSALMLFSCASTSKETVSADEAIVGVSVIGTIGMDGSKPRAIVVEYDRDLSGTKLDLSTFAVWDYGLSLSEKDLNSGKEAGKPLAVYLNEEPELSQKGGTKKGRYVIIEVNTDYSVGRYARSYKATMAAGVTQTNAVEHRERQLLRL